MSESLLASIDGVAPVDPVGIQRLAWPPMTLVLASSSAYRRELLGRLAVAFVTDSPDLDEERLPEERASDLVKRLSIEKARVVGERHPKSLVIGSDQVVIMADDILGKPGDFAANVTQLTRASGRRIEFRTGLCLLNTETGRMQSEVEKFAVTFRRLATSQIESYVRKERPYDCAGGFKSEGLGVALFESMQGADPTALVGLPLIRLVEMLAIEGVDVLSGADLGGANGD